MNRTEKNRFYKFPRLLPGLEILTTVEKFPSDTRMLCRAAYIKGYNYLACLIANIQFDQQRF